MRQEKQLLLKEIKHHFEDRPSFLIMSYAGFKANQANEFRTKVADLGGDVEVVPKRVLLKAAGDLDVSLDAVNLEGHIGLVFTGEDPLETTKAVFEYKKGAEALQIIGGRIDGELYNGDQVEQLSKLPSKDEMRAQLLSVFEAPMSQTVAVMNAVLSCVVYCLDNKAKQGEVN